MKFSVVITSHPELPAARAALNFCKALSDTDNKIHRIFFLSYGVMNASKDHSLSHMWSELLVRQHWDAVCCSSSAQKHALAGPNGEANHKVASGFSVSGLGQLIEATANSSRIVTFGQQSCS